MSKHTELPWTDLVMKQCSIPGQCLVIDKLTDGRDFSLQMSIRRAKYIVLACNSYKDLVTACEAWMKVESESLANHPCPDYTLRADYRKKAIKLTEAAIKKACPDG